MQPMTKYSSIITAWYDKWMKWLKDLEFRSTFGTVLMKNCLYIIAGVDDKDNILNTVRCLNLNTMTLTEISPVTEHRKWCPAAALNGFLYVVGGNNGSTQINSVEKWNPKTNEWSKVASMSVKRSNAGVIALKEKLYVVGGYSGGQAVSTAECYNPVQDVWQSIAPMGQGRQAPGVAVANGLLYVVGGHLVNTAERYDPQTNKWTFICSIREQLYPHYSCSTLNDKIVISSKDGFEEYDAVSNLWKKLEFVKPLDDIFRVFSYSGKLLTSQFSET